MPTLEGMGLVYAAELRPSKMELLAAWLPTQEWFDGDAPLVPLGAFRFDDPAGEVGLETHLVGAGSRAYQVPLSYRGAPLEGAEEFLVGTLKHSVLGSRWVYDATADPVYASELAAALLIGKPQAVETLEVDGQLEILPFTAKVSSTQASRDASPKLSFGVPVTDAGVTQIPCGPVGLLVQRVLDPVPAAPDALGLRATWEGQDVPVLLARASRPPRGH